jgi:hypothetical protein
MNHKKKLLTLFETPGLGHHLCSYFAFEDVFVLRQVSKNMKNAVRLHPTYKMSLEKIEAVRWNLFTGLLFTSLAQLLIGRYLQLRH